MNKMVKRITNHLLSCKFIYLFSIGYFLVRLTYIDTYFYLKDERDLILTALSLAHTGKDLFGASFPLLFPRISPQAPLLGMYWTVPFISLLHITSPLFVKIIYMIPTLFFPILIYEFILSVTKEKKISALTAFTVSFSPWFFHISRLALEAHLAYFFCLLGINLYVRKKKIAGVAFLILSYFSYFGIRPFIFLSIPYIELFYLLNNQKKRWKETIISLFIFTLLFSFIYKQSSRFENISARSHFEIMILNDDKLTQETNFYRSISNTPFSIREFFDNKPLVILNSIVRTFFKGVDFSYLFSSGDYEEMYANQVTGQFFPFLSLFLILGICAIAIKKKASYFFIVGFVFIGLTSSLINSYSLTFSLRSIFSLIGIGFICSLGILYAYELINEKRGRMFFIYTLTAIYFFFSIFFIYKYLFQNYNIVNNTYNEEERLLSQYSKKNTIKTVIVPDIHSYFLSYISIMPSLPTDYLHKIQREQNKIGDYRFDNHLFRQCKSGEITPKIVDALTPSTIIDEICLSPSAKIYIKLHLAHRYIPILSTEFSQLNASRAIKFFYFK